MSYRHMNFGANINWNKKEKVWAVLEERAPRKRPENRDEIPACVVWNKHCKEADSKGQTLENFINELYGLSSEAYWEKLSKVETQVYRRPRYKHNDPAELRTDREHIGGSRKKGGRCSWPRKMK